MEYIGGTLLILALIWAAPVILGFLVVTAPIWILAGLLWGANLVITHIGWWALATIVGAIIAWLMWAQTPSAFEQNVINYQHGIPMERSIMLNEVDPLT